MPSIDVTTHVTFNDMIYILLFVNKSKQEWLPKNGAKFQFWHEGER